MTATPVAEGEKGLNIESITWNGLTWVNIPQPTERETEYLAQHYPFHPLDLDDCLSRVQLPKIDEYPTYAFIVLHFPVFNKEARVTTPSQVSIFIGQDYLVTLHQGDLKPLVKLFRDCQLNQDAREEYMSRRSGYLLYRIVDRLVDYCFPIVNKIMENIEAAEDDIFDPRKRGARTVQEISVIRRDIISYRRINYPLRAVISTLEHKLRRFFAEDMEVYFGDVVDHLDKIWNLLDECKEVIEGLHDTNNSLVNQRTNEALRVLTIIGTIMLPLIVLSGLWSMNVPLPLGANPGGVHWFFWLILGWMMGVGGLMLYWFRRMGWL
ncbi:MAG TPA: magnesium transporter CorA family protein [Dehalococcoidia bacterium]|nr:magnesium transporter CorA family protein [Dehalococcoidia bacterium]